MKKPVSTSRSISVSLLLVVGLVAALLWSQRKPTTPTQPQPAAPKHDLAMARQLAFASPEGKTPLDRLLEKRQDAARRNARKLELWVLLGRAWVLKARSSGDPGFYINALACSRIARDIDPQSTTARSLQGLVLINNHEFRKARKLAQEILRADPQDQLALATLSDAELELGNYKKARKAAQTMLDLKPSLPSYSRLSYLMWLHNKTQGAKKSMQLAIDAGRSKRDREPGTWAIIQAALYFWQEGDYEGALAGTSLALKFFPKYAKAQVAHARVLISLQRYAQAIPYLKRALKQSPHAETAWLLADAYAALGRQKDAQRAYQTTEKLGLQMDARTLALFWATRRQKLSQARKIIEKEYAKRKDIYTADAYAWVLHRQGQHRRAAGLIERALRLDTPDPLLWYHAGAIYLAAGLKKRGRTYLKRALRAHPHRDITLPREARKLLGWPQTTSKPASRATATPTPRATAKPTPHDKRAPAASSRPAASQPGSPR